jgi:hypothetical protein
MQATDGEVRVAVIRWSRQRNGLSTPRRAIKTFHVAVSMRLAVEMQPHMTTCIHENNFFFAEELKEMSRIKTQFKHWQLL